MNSEFIDVSVYTDVLSYQKVSQLKRGVLIKSSQYYWTDPKFMAHWNDSGVYKMARGLWHFYQPNMPPDTQVASFLQAYHSIIGWKPKVNWLDAEEIKYKDPATGAMISILPTGKTAYTHWITQWLTTIEKETGYRPGIYTRASFWNFWVYPSGTHYTWNGVGFITPDWSTYPLWVANYFVSQPMLPRDWKTWDFWQYSGDRDRLEGIRSEIDLDYCSWDETKIKSLMCEPDPEPPKEPKPMPYRIYMPNARKTF